MWQLLGAVDPSCSELSLCAVAVSAEMMVLVVGVATQIKHVLQIAKHHADGLKF